MSIPPLFTSPCDFARRVPDMVSDFLDLENKIGRRFREDGVTDILIASLLRIVGSNATVFVPPETKTGGDFDIVIVEPVTGDAIQYRIQAKRLTPHANEWKLGLYRELTHPHGSGGQSSTLVRSAAHEKITTIPLYAFYNPEMACMASDGKLSGVELADGRQINLIVRALVKAKPKKPRLKRVGYLIDLFFPLSTILCSPSDGAETSDVIAPQVSLRAVESAIASREQPAWMSDEGIKMLPFHDSGRLEVMDHTGAKSPLSGQRSLSRFSTGRFPLLIEKAIERGGGERIQVAKIKRPKIVIISGPRALSDE